MNQKNLGLMIVLLVLVIAASACAPAPVPAQSPEETLPSVESILGVRADESVTVTPTSITLGVAPVSASPLLPPGNIANWQLSSGIQEGLRIIRSRLPVGQVGDNMFTKLVSQIYRGHNWMLRTLSSGEANMLASRALRAVYAIVYKLATRELFVVLVPMDECTFIALFEVDIPVRCYPLQMN